MKELIILRGIPGSGKTTIANLISNWVCSADDYFYDEKGNYNFNPTKLGAAHQSCLDKCIAGMVFGVEKIVIANTNTTKKEFQKYIDAATDLGYRYHVMVIENYHGNQNVHNVPAETLQAMKNRFTISL